MPNGFKLVEDSHDCKVNEGFDTDSIGECYPLSCAPVSLAEIEKTTVPSLSRTLNSVRCG
jgi:hypothetical protein